LNEAAMVAAASCFRGEHNFAAFAASDDRDGEGKSTVRTIFDSGLVRSGDRLIYTVRGSGFLKHMVRNIMGSLIEVGRGNLNEHGIAAFFAGKFTRKAGPTAPPKGLTLLSVEYPPAGSKSLE
jgi:tRNA pseudouridine38-40 synthase